MAASAPLPVELLCTPCPAHLLDFETTEALPAPDAPFAQERALDAVRTAIEIGSPGFNVFIMGEPGCDRHGAVRKFLEAHAHQSPPPGDWIYVNNFAEPNRPRALHLPAGRGAQLRADMQQFISELGQAIAAGFDSEEYRSRTEAIQNEYKEREETALGELGDASVEQGIAFIRTPQGFAFVPMKGEETLDPEAFAALPEAEREEIGKRIAVLRERLHRLLQQFPRWRREMQSRLRESSHEALQLAVGHLIEDLKDGHRNLPTVLSFLDEVLRHIVEVGQELCDQASKGEHAQGVIIPRSNVRHLMLRADVVEAAKAGDFRVHAVSTVDEAIELLTGIAAGATLTDGSMHQRIAARLAEFATRSKHHATRSDGWTRRKPDKAGRGPDGKLQ